MRHALADLKLDHLCVVPAGEDEFPLAERVRALPAGRILDAVPRLTCPRETTTSRPVAQSS